MRILSIIVAVALGSALPKSLQAQTWTLNDCLAYALEHNTDIAKRINECQRREVQWQSSKDARLPVVSSNIEEDINTGTFTGTGIPMKANLAFTLFEMSASMPLYTGSRLTSQIRSDKFSLLAAKEDLQDAMKNLKVNVASYYLQVLYNKGEIDIARKRLEVSYKMLNRAKSLYDKGKCPESDVAEAEATATRDESLLTTAEADYTMALLTLTQLLNLPATEAFEVCEPDGEYLSQQLPSFNEVYSKVENTYPSVKSADYTIHKAQQDVKVARSGYYPTLSLGASFRDYYYGLFDGGNPGLGTQLKDSYQAMVGLKLSIPIFNAFDTRNKIRRAKIGLMNAKVVLDDKKLQLRKNIEQAYFNALTAQKKYAAEVKAESANSLSYKYVEKRYDSGRSTIFDLNQSRQMWFSASENALRAKYEFLIRKKILDIYVE